MDLFGYSVSCHMTEREVNIAIMQVERKDIGGNAIMILTIAHPLSNEELAQVEQLKDLRKQHK